MFWVERYISICIFNVRWIFTMVTRWRMVPVTILKITSEPCEMPYILFWKMGNKKWAQEQKENVPPCSLSQWALKEYPSGPPLASLECNTKKIYWRVCCETLRRNACINEICGFWKSWVSDRKIGQVGGRLWRLQGGWGWVVI